MKFLGAKVLLILATLVDFASSIRFSKSEAVLNQILSQDDDEDDYPTSHVAEHGDQAHDNEEGDEVETVDESLTTNAASEDSNDVSGEPGNVDGNNETSSTNETRATSNSVNNRTAQQNGVILNPQINASMQKKKLTENKNLGNLTKAECPKSNFIGSDLSEGNISHCKKTANNVIVANWSQRGEDNKTIMICSARKIIFQHRKLKFHHGEVFVYNQKGIFNSLIETQSSNQAIGCPKDNSLVANDIEDVTEKHKHSFKPSRDKKNKLNISAEVIEPAVIACLLLVCVVLGAIIAKGGSKKYSGPSAKVWNARNEPDTKVTL